MADSEKLAKAKRLRERAIRALTKCDCAFPLETYRNGHGHAPTCASVPVAKDPNLPIDYDKLDD